MALFQTSGGTADDRRAEADRLYDLLLDHLDIVTHSEYEFIESCNPGEERAITPKMLFCLRDLKEKYAE